MSDFFSAEWLIMDYLRLLRRRFDKLDWSNQQADVAQLVEQPIRNRQVSGSSPLVGSIVLILSSSLRQSAHCRERSSNHCRLMFNKLLCARSTPKTCLAVTSTDEKPTLPSKK